jgi:predicted nucleotidyltransferase
MDAEKLLKSLNENKVDFVVIGATAFPVYGYARATLDIDLFVRGVNFENIWKNKISAKFGDTRVYFPCLDDMIRMKKAAGRAKDLEDLKFLKKIKARKK